MNVTKTLATVLAAGVALVGLTASSLSQADATPPPPAFTATCKAGAVTVTTGGAWHLNAAAPWKWDKGDKVSVDEHAASFKGAACAGTVKAFACSGASCAGPVPVPVN